MHTMRMTPSAATSARPKTRGLRVLYCEDDPVLRDMLQERLSADAKVQEITPCESPRQALDAAVVGQFDVALLDLALGEGRINGIDLGLALRGIIPQLPIVIFSQHAVPRVEDVLPPREQVSWSFVQKRGKLDVPGLVNILEATTLGVTSHTSAEHGPLPGSETLARLTPRQREVMALASAGYDARAIAERLHLAHVSVRRELSRAYKVLVPDAEPGMDLRTGAVLEYMRITSTSGSSQRLS